MLVRAYQRLSAVMDHDRVRRRAGTMSATLFWLRQIGLRFLVQIILFPHWLLLGPFRTFTQFARKDEGGMWIDSYNQFTVNNRVTLSGVLAIVLIAIVAVLVFVYLPIIYT